MIRSSFPVDQKGPMLFLVSTPIGNLEDITYRAVRILRESDVICCEDTRNTKKLLDRYDIHPKKLIALYSQDEIEESKKILSLAKENDFKVSYCSDAGMPGISDPGALLLLAFRNENIPAAILPGPSASLSALVLSGLDTADFSFYGFPPAKRGAKKTFFQSLLHRKETLLFYESPHRIKETLQIMSTVFPKERKAAIVRELTKIHEETIFGTLEELSSLDEIKGEIVLVLEGEKEKEVDIETIDKGILPLLKKGLPVKEISALLSQKYLLPKKEVYQRVLRQKERS